MAIILERQRWMEDCLGLGDPFLFFVQLSHSVIKVAQVSQDSLTFLSFPLPLCAQKCLFGFFGVGFFFFSYRFLFCFIQSRVSPPLANITSPDEFSLMYLCSWELPCAPNFALNRVGIPGRMPQPPNSRKISGGHESIVFTVLSSPENPKFF